MNLPHESITPAHHAYRAWWPWILCVVGLDYFSTLAYQPSIAYQAAGALAPLATAVIVLLTLLAAVPVYAHVAMRSPHGHGSMGMLERMVRGWHGKFIILAMLGFAATDFIFTRTLSVADAAVHVVENPNSTWQRLLDVVFQTGRAARLWSAHPLWARLFSLWDRQMVATLFLLFLGFVFWAMFRAGFTGRIVRLSVIVTTWFVLQTGVIVGAGIYYIMRNPAVLEAWRGQLTAGGTVHWWELGIRSVIVLPKMALGLSGFELCMVVMPLIREKPGPHHSEIANRVRDTHKLLLAAAGVMSILLVGSALVVTVLVPGSELAPGGRAANRTLAYLAHGGMLNNGRSGADIYPLFGQAFGTVYDVSTVLILCLAGASVTIGLRDLVPPYLHRLGMELHWAHAIGAMMYIFSLVKLIVTVVFHADVSAQRGAYATSVLVLLASAAWAVVMDRWPRPPHKFIRLPLWMLAAAMIFSVTALAVVANNPAGLIIALASIVCIMGLSILSRIIRTSEMRFRGFCFVDAHSRFLWDSLKALEFPVLVPHRPGRRQLETKDIEIRARHRLGPEVSIVFIEAELGDPSNFHHAPLMSIDQQEGRFAIHIRQCASIPHALAACALELSQIGRPPELHFGWSDESPLRANLSFVLFGQGNVPWMVRELIRHAQPDPDKRPQVIIG